MFDEEQHVQAAQQDRVDAEEVAGEDARCSGRRGTARQVGPSRRGAGFRRAARSTRRTVLGETTMLELGEFAADPRVAPARVLAREAHDQLARVRARPVVGPGRDGDGASGAGRGRGASEAASRASRSARPAGRLGAAGRARRAAPGPTTPAAAGGRRAAQHRELVAEDHDLRVAMRDRYGAGRAAAASRRGRGRGSEEPSRHPADLRRSLLQSRIRILNPFRTSPPPDRRHPVSFLTNPG